MGLNGFVWVSAGMTVERREGGEGFDAEGVYSDKNDVSLGFVITVFDRPHTVPRHLPFVLTTPPVPCPLREPVFLVPTCCSGHFSH